MRKKIIINEFCCQKFRCCNTCEEVLAAYRQRKWNVQLDKIDQCKNHQHQHNSDAFKEGCRIQGHLEVNRVCFIFNLKYNKNLA